MISCWEKMLTLISPLENGDIEEGDSNYYEENYERKNQLLNVLFDE